MKKIVILILGLALIAGIVIFWPSFSDGSSRNETDAQSVSNDDQSDERLADEGDFVSFIPPSDYARVESTYSAISGGHVAYHSLDYERGTFGDLGGETCPENGMRIGITYMGKAENVNPADAISNLEKRAEDNEFVTEWYSTTIDGEKFIFQRFDDSSCSGGSGSLEGFHNDMNVQIYFDYAGNFEPYQDLVSEFVNSIEFQG